MGRQRRALDALIAPRAGILDPQVAQDLHFGRNVVDLLTDIGADLLKGATAAADPLGLGELMADIDARQMRGELGSAGLASAELRLAQRRRFEFGRGTGDLAQFERDFGFVEQFALSGRDAQALAARSILVGIEDAQRFLEEANALVSRLEPRAKFGVLALEERGAIGRRGYGIGVHGRDLQHGLLSHVRVFGTAE